MHFVFKVRMWLPFFNTPGKLGSWNPVLLFEGSRFYLHLLFTLADVSSISDNVFCYSDALACMYAEF